MNIQYQRLWIDYNFTAESGIEPQIDRFRKVGKSALFAEGVIVDNKTSFDFLFIMKERKKTLTASMSVYKENGTKVSSSQYECFAL